MIENYLKELEKVLNDNAYDDVQSVIEYMREFAEDKKEEGETEEDIIASFGTVEDVASSILQKEIKTKEIASSLKEIDVRMMRADITFQVKDVNDVEVNFTDPKRFTIIDKEHILRIQEKKLKDGFFFGNHSAEVIVNVPCNVRYEKIRIEGASSDVALNNISTDKLKIEVASGDVEMKDCNIKEMHCECVSGDVEMKDCNIKEMHCECVSGDVDIKSSTAHDLHIECISGDIEIKNISTYNMELESVSGDMEVLISDDEKKYTIRSNQLFRSRKYGNGNKKIEATTISGDIDIDFE